MNKNCNYLDLNYQNSSDMNNVCPSLPDSEIDNLCTSQCKLYDNISENSQFISIKRSIDAGYGIINNPIKPLKETFDKDNIEGFTGKIFITDDYYNDNKNESRQYCPEGFKWSEQNKICEQKCVQCGYNDKYENKSREFNSYDPCFPNGVFDGYNNQGDLECTCGLNNSHCSNEFITDIYSSIGLLFS